MDNRLWQWMVKPVLSALAGAIFVVSVGTATVAVKGRINPRPYAGYTLAQLIEQKLYDKDFFDKNPDYRKHMARLSGNEPDLEKKLKSAWENAIYWYAPKAHTSTAAEQSEAGFAMYPYNLIATGKSGNCSEGSVIVGENVRNVVRYKGDRVRNYLLLVTYKASKPIHISGHALHLTEITRKDGGKRYRIGGINAFEDPSIEYKSVEEALERNTNYFRHYAYGGLTDAGILFGPDRWAMIDLDEHEIDLSQINAGSIDEITEKSKKIQRKLDQIFEQKARDYVAPK